MEAFGVIRSVLRLLLQAYRGQLLCRRRCKACLVSMLSGSSFVHLSGSCLRAKAVLSGLLRKLRQQVRRRSYSVMLHGLLLPIHIDAALQGIGIHKVPV